jgi:hypothetical protein
MASANIARGFKWLTSTAGALLGYVGGDGSDVEFAKKGTLAARPAASVYNVGMTYFADDTDGGTLYRNFTGISWTQIAVGLNYGTGVELYIRDTYANIDAITGSYAGQRAFCSDYGTGRGAQREWNGAAWVWAPIWQLFKVQHAIATAPVNDTNENTLFTFTLPKLGANDMLRCANFWTYTNSANSKTLKAKLDSSSGVSNAFTTTATLNAVYDIRNRNDASAQAWFSSGKTQFAEATQALSTTAKATGTAGVVFTLTGTKATGSETISLEFADLWICGGA